MFIFFRAKKKLDFKFPYANKLHRKIQEQLATETDTEYALAFMKASGMISDDDDDDDDEEEEDQDDNNKKKQKTAAASDDDDDEANDDEVKIIKESRAAKLNEMKNKRIKEMRSLVGKQQQQQQGGKRKKLQDHEAASASKKKKKSFSSSSDEEEETEEEKKKEEEKEEETEEERGKKINKKLTTTEKLMLAKTFLKEMGKSDLFLFDLVLWAPFQDLHRAIWTLVQPMETYPAVEEWDVAEYKVSMIVLCQKDLDSFGWEDDELKKLCHGASAKKKELLFNDFASRKAKLVSKLTSIFGPKFGEGEEEHCHQAATEKKNNKETTVIKDDKEQPQQQAEEPEEDDVEMMDFSTPRLTSKSAPAAICFELGEGYKLANSMVSFSSGSQHGSFEAISLIRETQAEEKSKRDFSINMPVRLLPSLQKSMASLRAQMGDGKHGGRAPSMAEIKRKLKTSDTVDLSKFTNAMPKIGFKLDDLISLRSEQVKWGKSTVDVLTFTRHNKDKSKKGFSMHLPARLFPALEVAVEYIATTKK